MHLVVPKTYRKMSTEIINENLLDFMGFDNAYSAFLDGKYFKLFLLMERVEL